MGIITVFLLIMTFLRQKIPFRLNVRLTHT